MEDEGQSSAASDPLDGEVHAAREGDASALSRLMEAVRPSLKRSVEAQMRWPLSQKLDPSDLAQEALLSAVRGFGGFRGRTWREFVAWATRIARMEALKAQRHWSLAMRDLRRERPADESDFPADWDRPTELHVGEWRDTASRLLRLIDQLPSQFQEVIRLRFCEGLTVRDIADRTGRNREAVAGILRRGLDWLRELADREGLQHE
jgi:RNA polymerase sigma factor (sigma-70 family)